MPLNKSPDRLVAINVFDTSPADENFITSPTSMPLEWISYSGLPANLVEKRVRAIRLSRYRAALQTALAVKPGRFVISHLPNMTAAVSAAMQLLGRQAPHLAFAFNFTDFPAGRRLSYFRRTLAKVDQFTVFSEHERPIYTRLFDIDEERIRPVIWTQDVPPVQAEPGLDMRQPYLCAVGGEGRDFATLLEAARRVGPAVKFVVIARPHSLARLSVPENVEVLVNIPLARVWRIALDSQGVLVPLKSRETCCGHITLVGAKQLGIPCATTYAHATREYVEGRAAVLECEPGDPAAFAGLIGQMMDDASGLRGMAVRDMERECAIHDRAHWTRYLEDFIRRRVLGPA